MGRFSFRKNEPESTGEDEGLPPLEGDLGDAGGGAAEPTLMPAEDERSGRTRRPFIIAGVGVLVIVGAYLASQLFLAPAPPPPPVRQAVPLAQPKPASPPAPQQTSPPAAPVPSTPAPVTAKAPAQPQAPIKPGTPGPAPIKPAEPSAPTKTATAKAPTPEKAVAAPPAAESKASTKPEAPKVAARPSPAHAVTYSLQVGAMVVEENAQNLRRRLEEKGFQASIRKGTAFITKHVVTVGDPSGKREAEELSRRLNVDGFPSQLMAAESKYAPQVGAFFNLDEAIDLARELQKKNYQPKIGSNQANTVVYQVRYGRFDSRAAALKRGEQLKAQGFTYMVVPN